MSDTELLNALDEIHQVPYPTFSAEKTPESFWSGHFEGWRVPDPTDTTIYPTIREAIKEMIR
jgi:hypothetical protein